MTCVDVNAFIGAFPYRNIGGSIASLLHEMTRVGIEEAWVSHLSAMYWRDPTAGNAALFTAQEQNQALRAIPAVHPGLPDWLDQLTTARRRNVPAVRCDPTFYGLAPAGAEVLELAAACADCGLPLLMAVRLEDGRQRHPNDHAGDLPPWAVRQLLRAVPRLQMVVTHADRDFIEQVHFGSTLGEASRVLWDISWIWGPPEDHLALLLETVGGERFTFGTGMPLRLPDTTIAKLDLLQASSAVRQDLTGTNLRRFLDHAIH